MAGPARRPGRLWIVDGHNVVFAVPVLAALQETDRRREARERLADCCRRFASGRRHRVLLVFDGDDQLDGNPGARTEPLLEVAYATGTDADSLVVFRTARAAEAGETVTVVSDDRGIRAQLPRGVETAGSMEFWELAAPRIRAEEKRAVEAPDIDEHFLKSEAPPGAPPRRRRVPVSPGLAERRKAAETVVHSGTLPPPVVRESPGADVGGATIGERARREAAAGTADAPARGAVPDPEEARRLKKERGRRKQERRLEAMREKKKR